jgi:hypothetical protein
MVGLYAEQPAPSLDATYRVETVYPSMTERHVVKLDVSDWDGIWAARGGAPDIAKWPWTDARRYYVRRAANGERVPVERVDVPGFFKDPDNISLLYLVLDPAEKLREDDELEVLLLRDNKAASLGKAPVSNRFKVAGIQKYNAGLTPSYAANQALIDGSKRNVAHLEQTLEVHELYSLGSKARGYLNVDNIFSTDWKDKSTQIQAIWGIFERSLASSWFIPVHLETELAGDQRMRYSSSVTSLGLRTLMPWKFTKPALYNGFVQAPVAPLFQLDAQFERRMPRTSDFEKKFPQRNVGRFEAQMSWSTIQLLPQSGSEKLSLEIAGKAWYLPRDRNTLNRPIERLEGEMETSLLVPLAKFSLSGLNFVTDEKAKATQRVRIKYVHGAIESLGFLHSSQLSVGVEFVK